MIKKVLVILPAIVLLLVGCVTESSDDATANGTKKKELTVEEDRDERLEKIKILEEKVEADKQLADIKSRKQLLVAYAGFINNHHEHEMTPEFLFRSGKLANEVGKPRRAIEYLTDLHDGFPSYPRRAEAAFLVGFIYENMLNDREMAQKAYETVIDNFPETQWAKDAQATIELLYLTDAQKIAKFKEQQEDKQ